MAFRGGAGRAWLCPARTRSGSQTMLAATGLVLLAAVLGSTVPCLEAQEPERHTVTLRGVPILDALEELVALTGIDLLYGSEVASTGEASRVFCQVEEELPEDLLACVVRSVGMDYYQLSSGTYVVISDPEGTPEYGSLTGVVTDRRTGTPVPNADIQAFGSPAVARSNEAGLFSVGSLLPGRYELRISSHGYQPMRTSVEIPPGAETRIGLALSARPFPVRPLIVDGTRAPRRARTPTAGAAMDVQDALDGEGTLLGELGALPGIMGIFQRPLVSDVLIQGGDAGEQRLRIDGIPLYNPPSIQGLLGTFSPVAIERLTVRKSGFPVRHGSAVAGILDFEQSTGSAHSPIVELEADRTNLNGRLSLPIPGLGGVPGSVMLAGRTTLWDLMPEPVLEETLRDWNRVDPVLASALLERQSGAPELAAGETVEYRGHDHTSSIGSRDLHLAARLPTGATGTARLSLYNGVNDVATRTFAAGHPGAVSTPDRLMLSRDAYDWSSLGGRVRYDRFLGPRSVGAVEIIASRHRFQKGYDMAQDRTDSLQLAELGVAQAERRLSARLPSEPETTEAFRIDEVGLKTEIERSVGARHQLYLALQGVRTESSASLGGLAYTARHVRASQTRVALAVEDRWSLGVWSLESGLRTTWSDAEAGVALEPRMAVESDFETELLGTVALRLAAGAYRQFSYRLELANPGPSALVPSVPFWLPSTSDVKPPRAEHLSLETAIRPSEDWEVRAEAYGRRTRDLPVLDYGALLDGAVSPASEGPAGILESSRKSSVGFGIRLNRDGAPFRFQLGYDAVRTRTRYETRFGGQSVPDPGGAPQRVLARLDYDLGPGWTVRARGNAAWDRSWGFRRAYYDVLTLHDARPDLGVGLPGERRPPPLFEVDLGVAWSGRAFGADVEVAADVLNVLDRNNVADYGLRRIPGDSSTFQVVPRYTTGFRPTISLRTRF